jgi:hypothetical protein
MIRVFFAVSPSINLATISRAESSKCARISELASARARWARLYVARPAALCIALPGLVAMLGVRRMPASPSKRKLPMKFSWVACQPNCRGWVSAVGIVTADSPRDFDEFARGRQLGDATIVLDSSGGSVNDSMALGRRWRNLGALTTVGISVQTNTAQGAPASIAARGVLRIDVRVPTPVGQDALRARDCPCSRASDLDRRLSR